MIFKQRNNLPDIRWTGEQHINEWCSSIAMPLEIQICHATIAEI